MFSIAFIVFPNNNSDNKTGFNIFSCFSLPDPDFKFNGEHNSLNRCFKTREYVLTEDYVSLDEFLAKNQSLIVEEFKKIEYSKSQLIFKLLWKKVTDEGKTLPESDYISTPCFYKQQDPNMLIEELRRNFYSHVDNNKNY